MGYEFSRHHDGTMELKQNYLILEGFKDELTGKHTSSVSKPPLHKDEFGPPRKNDWHCRSLIVMLNYLEKNSQT